MYDAVIVGAGLAGLAAARSLAGRKVLLLERAPRIGGRVLTHRHGDLPYDLGALFASPVNLEGFRERIDALPATGRVGLHVDGRWHYGESPGACMRSAFEGAPGDMLAMAAFAEGRRDARQLPERALAVLNAFHQVLHPATVDACIPPRQRDGLAGYAQGFPAGGNETLVGALAGALSCAPVTGAEALRVDDHGDWARIEFRERDSVRIVRSRAVVIATPPDTALALLPSADDELRRFLGGVRFLPGLVAAVIVNANDVAPLQVCVATDLPFNTVIRCHRAGASQVSLQVYYLGNNLAAIESLHDAARGARVVDDLVAAGLLTRSARIAHVDVRAWAGIGPEISADAYRRGARWQASPRILLAGDYTWFEGDSPFPFGMGAAIESGTRAGTAVAALLASPAPSQRAPAATAARPAPHPMIVEPLLHGSVFAITPEAPHFLQHVAEGNVAYYGLLLQASGEPWIRQWLEGAAVDGLWEFHTGFGVTAADSALVMEGLLARGGDRDRLRDAAGRLVERFFDEHAGAFRTVNDGRAAYWKGVSVETTAHVAYLLHRIDADAWHEVVARCTQYVRRAQDKAGYWEGRWYPSRIIPTYYATRLLRHAAIERSAQRLLKARNWLVASQQKNGGWSALVTDTAAAVLTLREIGGADNALEMGLEWLGSRMRGADLAGEPVLYYWYDDEARKRFFVARDASGRIARAWAALALRGDA